MFLLYCCLCGVINDDDRGDGLGLVLWHLETFYVFECSEWPRKVKNTQRYVYDSKARVVQQHKNCEESCTKLQIRCSTCRPSAASTVS